MSVLDGEYSKRLEARLIVLAELLETAVDSLNQAMAIVKDQTTPDPDAEPPHDPSGRHNAT